MPNTADLVPRVAAPQRISLDFSLEEGFATLTVRCGEQEFAIEEFGPDADGLGDLVRAALNVATGSLFATVLFDCEPRRWGLAIEPAGLSPENERVSRLTIRDGGATLSDEGHSGLPTWDWSSQVMLCGFVTTDGFAAAVRTAASKAREDFDDATYRQKWGDARSLEGFPLRGLCALEAALAVPEYRE